MFDILLQDVRYALRQLVRAPASSLVIVATLGITLAASASLFSVLNATLLEELPFHQPDRVVFFMHRYKDMMGSGTVPLLLDYRRELECCRSVSGSVPWNANLTEAGEPERLRGLLVSADFFETLGVDAWRGRTFRPEEERPGQEHVAIVSHGLWQRRFGSDPDMIGSTIELNGNPYEVVGIMSPGFEWGRGWGREAKGEVWAPFTLTSSRTADTQRGDEYVDIHARLRDQVSVEQAQAELDGLRLELRSRFPDRYTEASGFRVVPVAVQEIRIAGLRPALLLVFGAVAALLLIAATNVAGLRLAEAAGRRREVSVRGALGASRRRLVRQMLTEATVLAGVSAALGLLLTRIVVGWLDGIGMAVLPRAQPIELDGTVVGFTLTATLLTALICGLAPALSGSRDALAACLRSTGATAGSGRTTSWTHRGLVIAQTALALTLLIGAGLLVRSFVLLQDVSTGYRTERILSARISLPSSRYGERPSRVQFMDAVLENLRLRPSVGIPAAISSLPLSGANNSGSFHIEGHILPPDQPQPHAESWSATPDYFRALGIPLIRGRVFDARDRADSPPVVLVNDTLARRYFPDEDPLGKRIDFQGRGEYWTEIVGVVGDVRDRHLDQEAKPQYYTPYDQRPFRDMFIVVHSSGDPLEALPNVRQAVRATDPDLPLYDVTSMERLVEDNARDRRAAMWALLGFGGAALTLALLGLYGLLSYTVRMRTAELGLRMALGARGRDLVACILGEGTRLVLWGAAAGFALVILATRLLKALVFGIEVTDPATYIVVAVLLVVAALSSCAVPAWRAARIDPIKALRAE